MGSEQQDSADSGGDERYWFPYSDGFKRLAYFMTVLCFLATVVAVLNVLLLVDEQRVHRLVSWWLGPIGLAFATFSWYSRARRASGCWLVCLGEDRVELDKPKTGAKPARQEMRFADVGELTRPSSPKSVLFKPRSGKALRIRRFRMTARDWDDFIVRLREVIADRFTIPEEW